MRASPKTLAAARRLRRNLSPPEAMLWGRLRTRSKEAPAFRRQHPIGPFVLDFYCARARLAVEIDGRVHEVEGRPRRDAKRDEWLQAQGVDVLRIPASDVLANLDEVADGLMRLALARMR